MGKVDKESSVKGKFYFGRDGILSPERCFAKGPTF